MHLHFAQSQTQIRGPRAIAALLEDDIHTTDRRSQQLPFVAQSFDHRHLFSFSSFHKFVLDVIVNQGQPPQILEVVPVFHQEFETVFAMNWRLHVSKFKTSKTIFWRKHSPPNMTSRPRPQHQQRCHSGEAHEEWGRFYPTKTWLPLEREETNVHQWAFQHTPLVNTSREDQHTEHKRPQWQQVKNTHPSRAPRGGGGGGHHKPGERLGHTAKVQAP